jgi:hypothetical protein
MTLYRSAGGLFGRETLGVKIDRLALGAFSAELWANAYEEQAGVPRPSSPLLPRRKQQPCASGANRV